LKLVVSDAGDGTREDHADWADAKFITDNNEIIYLSDLKEINYTQGWNELGKDKSVAGRILTLNGVEYDKGLGTHANGEILYTIPAGAVRFESVIGVDDEARENGSVQFIVYAK